MKTSTSLFNKMVAGLVWTGGGAGLKQILNMIIRLILARLLAPEDFGLIALAMVVINFTNWFLDLGFGSALVQRKDLTEAHKSTAFWTNVLMGWLVFICLALTAPLVARFFGSEQITPILIALSFGIVLISPRATLDNLFVRDFNFQVVASRQILGVFLGGVTGIILALNGFGVWALVGDSLVESFFSTLLLFWQSSWRPKFLFSRQAFIDLWSFSMFLTGARLFNYFSRNLDTILIGRFLDANSLGIYNLGYQLVLMPLFYVTRPVNQVLFTTFSKLQDDPERLRHAYLKSLQLVAFLTFPLMTMLALSTPTLIPELLGEKWRAATPLFPFLCIVGLIQSIQNLMPAVFQATGRTSMIFCWTLITLVGNVIAFAVGLRGGILGVAIAYTAITLALLPLLFGWLLKVLDLSWIHFFQALLGTFVSTLNLVLTWSLLEWFFGYLNLGNAPLITIFIQIILTGGIYLLISWRWTPIVKDTLWRLKVFSFGKIKNLEI